MNTDRARQLRNNQTLAERTLWQYLRKHQRGVKFRRQQPIGPYITDFVCFEKRLIIEIDGGQHQEQIEYDAIRTEWLKQQGYKVLRFWNNEVLSELAGVITSIEVELNLHPLPGPPP
jgi:very-short-patch-repair endonuclease